MAEDKKINWAPTAELGGSGTFDSDGQVVDDDTLRELSGSRGRRIYTKMQYDGTITAILFAINMMLRRTKWTCVPWDRNMPEAMELATWYETLMEDMSNTWEHFISNVLSMVPYGWSFFEIVYKRRLGREPGGDKQPSKYDDGLWGVRKLAFRPQDTLDRWDLDQNGGLRGMFQRIYTGPDAGEKYLPIDKALLFRAQYWKESPEGLSCLRGAYGSWLYLKGIDRAEAYGIERELNGLPVMSLPAKLLNDAASGDPDAQEAKAQYTQIVRDVRLNKQAGVLLPSDCYQNPDGTMSNVRQYVLELLTGGGRRAIDVESAANRHSVTIARTVLADFLMLGTGSKTGSQSLGDSRTELFTNALDGWNDSIAEVLNRFLIPRIAQMNGFDEEILPYYQAESANPVDVQTLVDCLEKYMRSGGQILPDNNVDAEVRSQLGLPPADPVTEASRTAYDPSLDPNNPENNTDTQSARATAQQTDNDTENGVDSGNAAARQANNNATKKSRGLRKHRR